MVIDSKVGGMGDVWMRLLTVYTLSDLVREKHTLIVNAALAPISDALFGDRITIRTEGKPDAVYTHYGLRHLIFGMVQGTKYLVHLVSYTHQSGQEELYFSRIAERRVSRELTVKA
jgi:hypothetical protein